jgi:hypothetical protein
VPSPPSTTWPRPAPPCSVGGWHSGSVAPGRCRWRRCSAWSPRSASPCSPTSWAWLAGFLMVAGIANGIAFPPPTWPSPAGSRSPSGGRLRHQTVGRTLRHHAGRSRRAPHRPHRRLALGVRGGRGRRHPHHRRLERPTGRRAFHPRDLRSDVPGRAVWILSLSAFFAVNASASLGAFYVESAVAGGISPGVAGTFLSIGSGCRHPHPHRIRLDRRPSPTHPLHGCSP